MFSRSGELPSIRPLEPNPEQGVASGNLKRTLYFTKKKLEEICGSRESGKLEWKDVKGLVEKDFYENNLSDEFGGLIKREFGELGKPRKSDLGMEKFNFYAANLESNSPALSLLLTMMDSDAWQFAWENLRQEDRNMLKKYDYVFRRFRSPMSLSTAKNIQKAFKNNTLLLRGNVESVKRVVTEDEGYEVSFKDGSKLKFDLLVNAANGPVRRYEGPLWKGLLETMESDELGGFHVGKNNEVIKKNGNSSKNIFFLGAPTYGTDQRNRIYTCGVNVISKNAERMLEGVRPAKKMKRALSCPEMGR